jgi:hypothetical protein
MITNFIVISSLVLALGFTIAWLARADLRRRIEGPKHFFQQRLQQYDRQCHASRDDLTGITNDSP